MNDFVETRILSAIRKLLTGRVNEILQDTRFSIPLVEFGKYSGGSTVVPVVSLSTCERSEKERILRLDAYSLTITFSHMDTPESELFCYAYSAAVCIAINENPTLGGIAERAIINGKKYLPPKNPNCGEGWGVVISLRISVEGANNVC
jgi:hypothetical protein